MRESMACLTTRFSSNRMLREYTENYYVPLARAWQQRNSAPAIAGELEAWHKRLQEHWPRIHFGNVITQKAHDSRQIEVQVYLDDIPPQAVSVELYADARNGGEPLRVRLECGTALEGTANAWLYSGQIANGRPLSDYTPRIIPAHPMATVPLEANMILWHR